jgi:hypothetical protein
VVVHVLQMQCTGSPWSVGEQQLDSHSDSFHERPTVTITVGRFVFVGISDERGTNMSENDKLEAARRLLTELRELYRALSIVHRRVVRDSIMLHCDTSAPDMAKAG